MAATVSVIVCAAGASSRFGSKKKKTFTDVAGRAVALRSVEIFANRDDVKQIILAIAPDDEEMAKIKWGPSLKFHGVKICHGAKERSQTVANALELVKDDVDLVAVHDAARCCVTSESIDAVFAEAGKNGAAILAAPVTATLKQVRDKTIEKTVDRKNIYEAQTPQVFSRALIKKAYAEIEKLDKETISDDAQLIEALGHKVSVVETDSTNIKITYKSDIAIAEAILKAKEKKPARPLGPYEEAQW